MQCEHVSLPKTQSVAFRSHAYGAGAQLTVDNQATRACGYVTSSCYSPALQRHLGLALASREFAIGAELVARDPLRNLETRVRITSPVHYDPNGARMKSG